MNYEDIEAEYGSAIRRIAASYAPPGAERDDLEQEIALAIYEALPKFEGESDIKTYVYRIAQNCGIDRIRRRKLDTVGLEDAAPVTSSDHGPEQRALKKEKYERLASAVRALPLKYRQPLVLRLEGLSYDEIADVLDLTSSNVGVRLHRAKQQLKGHVEEQS